MDTKNMDIEQLSNNLCDKVNAEYTEFIENMQKQSAEYIIEAAYEIVWKDNIAQFIENEPFMLSKKQYAALLSAKNTLDEIYDEWLSNGDLHTYGGVSHILQKYAESVSEKYPDMPKIITPHMIRHSKAMHLY